MAPSKLVRSRARPGASTGMRPAALLLLALAVSGARGSSAAAFADRAALKTAVDACLAKVPSGFECCSRADFAACGDAGRTDMPGWDVSLVTDMITMFYGAAAFNQDISSWDVSGVTRMISMFFHARAFNQDIGSWDVSAVTGMDSMFRNAASFNQDIGSWNVAAVTGMGKMFHDAASFDQDITGWTMKGSYVGVFQMFRGANAFLAAYTNCGHPASYNAGICTSASYDSSDHNYLGVDHGPPTAWQINVPVVIIPPPVVVASPIIAATGTATATASPAATGTATTTASPASGGWTYSSAQAAGDRVIFAPSYPSGLHNHVGVLETRTGDFVTRATMGVSSSTVWKFCGVVPEGNKVFFARYGKHDVGVFDSVTNVVTTFAAETNAASVSGEHCAAVMVGDKVFGYACSLVHQCSHGSMNQSALG